MSEISLFDFEGNEIRYVGDGVVHEWVAKDVCTALHPSANPANLSNYLKSVNQKRKGNKIVITPGGEQSVVTLLEGGLYELLSKSRSKTAERFQDWLYEEVLPSIRQTGSYTFGNLKGQLEPREKELKFLNGVKDLIDRLTNPSPLLLQKFEDRLRDALEPPSHTPALSQAEKTEWTIRDRLEYREIRGCENYESPMGRLAAKKYRDKYNKDPLKGHRIFNGKQRKCTVYRVEDVDLIDAAIDEYLAKKLGGAES